MTQPARSKVTVTELPVAGGATVKRIFNSLVFAARIWRLPTKPLLMIEGDGEVRPFQIVELPSKIRSNSPAMLAVTCTWVMLRVAVLLLLVSETANSVLVTVRLLTETKHAGVLVGV